MEFWGVEVKSGQVLRVSPGDAMLLHLSQASIGESKLDNDSCVHLFVNVDGKKLVLGTLFSQRLPQQQFDIVFERDFELWHNFKSGSVYFFGYMAEDPMKDEESSEGDPNADEENFLNHGNNGRLETKAKQVKPAEVKMATAARGKEHETGKKVKIVEPYKKAINQEDDYDGDDAMYDDEDDPKVESSKKRLAETPITPVPNKKAKVNPQGTDGKKAGSHVSTPYPSKQTVKAPAKFTNKKTPKSDRTHECKSCSRKFGSEQALDSHTKAKHGK